MGIRRARKTSFITGVWFFGLAILFAEVLFSAHALSQVATPLISKGDFQFPIGFDVTVTCSTQGAVIHYSTNGTTPTESDPIVPNDNFVTIPRTLTLMVKAWSGTQSSAVATSNFKVTGDIAGGAHTPWRLNPTRSFTGGGSSSADVSRLGLATKIRGRLPSLPRRLLV